MRQHTTSRHAARLAVVLAATTGLLAVAPAMASGEDSPSTALAERLEAAAGDDGAYRTLEQVQAIADANGQVRDDGSDGWKQTVDLFAGELKASGYTVWRQRVPYKKFIVQEESARTSTNLMVPVFMVRYSNSTKGGGVNAPVVVLPIAERAPSTTGCNAADYAGLPVKGAIVVVPFSPCGRATQANLAEKAGAVALLEYFLQPDPSWFLRVVVLGEAPNLPLGTISRASAKTLAAAPAGTVRMNLYLKGKFITDFTENLFAQSTFGDQHKVVMAGAHLDSASEGPGLNDNISAAAAVLRIAKELGADHTGVKNAVRFAFWGAEERVLVGSNYYAQNLSAQERADIAMYLNAELIAGSNFGRFVVDSRTASTGSGAPTDALIEYYAMRDVPIQILPPKSIKSDDEPIMALGIPTGAITGGTMGVKTPAQAALWGGTAGQQFDPCYHQICDNLASINRPELVVNSRAMAWVVGAFASGAR